jgi:hypothetical protein
MLLEIGDRAMRNIDDFLALSRLLGSMHVYSHRRPSRLMGACGENRDFSASQMTTNMSMLQGIRTWALSSEWAASPA